MIRVEYHSSLPLSARQIRTAVFMEEQGFKDEFDNTDDNAIHFLLYKDDVAVATGRMFTEDDGKSYHIGRVAVLKEYRQFHLGAEIMKAMINRAKELGAEKIVLSAQCRVSGFYKSLGFYEMGEVYMDEHCPHIQMVLDL